MTVCKRPIAICLLLLLTCGCNNAPDPVVGNDIDIHGCRPSAGYSYCYRTKQCEQPWQLAARERFGNQARSFDAWCGN